MNKLVTKSAARRSGRSYRRQLKRSEYLTKSGQITHYLRKLLSHCDVDSVSIYLPNDNEPDISGIKSYSEHRRLLISAPVITRFDQGKMSCLPYLGRFNLRRNRWDLREPIFNAAGEHINEHPCSDIMLMPLTAFDGNGCRVGMGKGFYDRYLERKQRLGETLPLLVGVGFEGQRVDGKIDSDEWDFSMDAVITERGLFRPE